MDESQREAMYNAWLGSRIKLVPEREVDDEKVTISVIYEGEKYSETFYRKDCYGTAEPHNIAYNRLVDKMRKINKRIEISYF